MKKLPRTALALALVLLGWPILPAQAAVPADFTITGAGWGHGIGLSQYGAKGMALAGKSAAEIVTYYFTGSEIVADQPPTSVRVGLDQDRKYLSLRGENLGGPSANLRLTPYDAAGTKGTAISVKPNVETQVKISAGNAVVIDAKSGTELLNAPKVVVSWNPDATVINYVSSNTSAATASGYLGALCATPYFSNGQKPTTSSSDSCSHRYRYGTLEIRAGAFSDATSDLNVVNIVNLEEYLRGIAEVPSSWPSAALQAQVITSRSFAVFRNASQNSGCLCNVVDTDGAQVFVGFNKEYSVSGDKWLAAISATQSGGNGMVARVAADDAATGTKRGDIVQAYFSSSAGGAGRKTQASHEVWFAKKPYLQSVDDSWSSKAASDNPNAQWSITVTQSQMVAALNTLGLNLTSVQSVTIDQTYASGAVKLLVVTSEDGTVSQLPIGGSSSSAQVLPAGPANRSPDSLRAAFNKALGNSSGIKSSYWTSITNGLVPGVSQLTSVTVATWPTDVVKYQIPAQLSGTVAPAVANATVTVQRLSSGKWVSAEKTKTDDLGNWKLNWSPQAIGAATLRIVASNEAGSVQSDEHLTTVVGKVYLKSPTKVAKKKAIKLTGSLRPYTANMTVIVEKQLPDLTWAKVGQTKTTKSGKWKFRFTAPAKAQKLSLRARVSSPTFGRVASTVDVVTVR